MSGMGNQIKGMGNDLVREARRRVGLTQERLADEAGTTQSAIARLESGRTSPAFDDVIRLLRIMGLDLDFMLVERDDSDWIQAQRLLPLSPDERHARHKAWSEQVNRIRGRAA
jgi:transcriptional regulator with XRE-family HTH domain